MLLITLNPDSDLIRNKIKTQYHHSNYITAKEAQEIFDELTQTPYDYPLKIEFLRKLKKCFMKVFFELPNHENK